MASKLFTAIAGGVIDDPNFWDTTSDDEKKQVFDFARKAYADSGADPTLFDADLKEFVSTRASAKAPQQNPYKLAPETYQAFTSAVRDLESSPNFSSIFPAGHNVTVASGGRSFEEQQQLYDDFKAGRSSRPAAKPGSSKHEKGNALDLNWKKYNAQQQAAIRDAMTAKGFQTLSDPREAGHFFLPDAPAAPTPAAPVELKPLTSAADMKLANRILANIPEYKNDKAVRDSVNELLGMSPEKFQAAYAAENPDLGLSPTGGLEAKKIPETGFLGGIADFTKTAIPEAAKAAPKALVGMGTNVGRLVGELFGNGAAADKAARETEQTMERLLPTTDLSDPNISDSAAAGAMFGEGTGQGIGSMVPIGGGIATAGKATAAIAPWLRSLPGYQAVAKLAAPVLDAVQAPAAGISRLDTAGKLGGALGLNFAAQTGDALQAQRENPLTKDNVSLLSALIIGGITALPDMLTDAAILTNRLPKSLQNLGRTGKIAAGMGVEAGTEGFQDITTQLAPFIQAGVTPNEEQVNRILDIGKRSALAGAFGAAPFSLLNAAFDEPGSTLRGPSTDPRLKQHFEDLLKQAQAAQGAPAPQPKAPTAKEPVIKPKPIAVSDDAVAGAVAALQSKNPDAIEQFATFMNPFMDRKELADGVREVLQQAAAGSIKPAEAAQQIRAMTAPKPPAPAVKKPEVVTNPTPEDDAAVAAIENTFTTKQEENPNDNADQRTILRDGRGRQEEGGTVPQTQPGAQTPVATGQEVGAGGGRGGRDVRVQGNVLPEMRQAGTEGGASGVSAPATISPRSALTERLRSFTPEQQSEEAFTDFNSGVLNYLAWQEDAHDGPVAVFGHDSTKAFNDSHNHDFGNAAYAVSGQALQRAAAELGLPVYKVGGDFAVPLPKGSNVKAVQAQIERRANEIKDTLTLDEEIEYQGKKYAPGAYDAVDIRSGSGDNLQAAFANFREVKDAAEKEKIKPPRENLPAGMAKPVAPRATARQKPKISPRAHQAYQARDEQTRFNAAYVDERTGLLNGKALEVLEKDPRVSGVVGFHRSGDEFALLGKDKNGKTVVVSIDLAGIAAMDKVLGSEITDKYVDFFGGMLALVEGDATIEKALKNLDVLTEKNTFEYTDKNGNTGRLVFEAWYSGGKNYADADTQLSKLKDVAKARIPDSQRRPGAISQSFEAWRNSGINIPASKRGAATAWFDSAYTGGNGAPAPTSRESGRDQSLARSERLEAGAPRLEPPAPTPPAAPPTPPMTPAEEAKKRQAARELAALEGTSDEEVFMDGLTGKVTIAPAPQAPRRQKKDVAPTISYDEMPLHRRIKTLGGISPKAKAGAVKGEYDDRVTKYAASNKYIQGNLTADEMAQALGMTTREMWDEINKEAQAPGSLKKAFQREVDKQQNEERMLDNPPPTGEFPDDDTYTPFSTEEAPVQNENQKHGLSFKLVRDAFPNAEIAETSFGWGVKLPNGAQILITPTAEIQVAKELVEEGLGRKLKEGEAPTASYTQVNGLDRVGIMAITARGRGEIGHEALHAAMRMALSTADQVALMKYFQSPGDKPRQTEERIAVAYNNWRWGRKFSKQPFVDRVFGAVKSFFDRFLGVAEPVWERVFKDLESGKAWETSQDLSQAPDMVEPDADVLPPPSPDTMASVFTMDAWKDKARAWMAANDYTKKEIDKFMAAVEVQVKPVSDLDKKYDLESLFPRTDKARPSKRGGIQDNSDKLYVITFDSTSLCQKRDKYAPIVDALIKQFGALTDNEVRGVIVSMKNEGLEVPCMYCYVESGRQKAIRLVDNTQKAMRTGDAAGIFTEADNKTLVKKNLELAYLNKLYGNTAMADRHLAAAEEAVAKLAPQREEQPDGSIKKIQPTLDTVSFGKNPLTIDDAVVTGSSIRALKPKYKLAKGQTLGDLFDPNWFSNPALGKQLEKFKSEHKELGKYVATQYGGGNAKGYDTYVEYSGEFLKELDPKAPAKEKYGLNSETGKPNNLYSYLQERAGVRFQSNSDLRPQHAVDIVQAILDLALIKSRSHAYTKVPAYVRLLGRTGQKINTSLFAQEVNGEIVPDTWQGMDWETAKKFSEEYPDVGGIMVGTTDNIIKWALQQPWIHQIIPFHASQLPTPTMKRLGWQDYTSDQHETAAKADVKVTDIRHFEIVRKARQLFAKGDKTRSAFSDKEYTQAYFEICKERGYNPVFWDYAQRVYGVKTLDELLAKVPTFGKLRKDFARTDTPFNPVTTNIDTAFFSKYLQQFAKAGGAAGVEKANAPQKKFLAHVADGIKAARASDGDFERIAMEEGGIIKPEITPKTEAGKLVAALAPKGRKAPAGETMASVAGPEALKNLPPEEAKIRAINLQIAKEAAAEFGLDNRLTNKNATYVNRIRLATGWYLDVDGKWKYEIDDSGMKLKDISGATLEESVDHPKLFSAYPQLRNLSTKISVDPENREFAGYSPADAHGDAEIRISVPSEDGLRQVLLHEIQHAVQNIEGFQGGGSPRRMAAKQDVGDDLVKDINQKLSQASRRIGSAKPGTKEYDTARQEYNNLLSQRQSVVDEYRLQLTPHEAYRRVSGEMQARDAEYRAGLSEEERKARMPYEDVQKNDRLTPDDAIVGMQGGTMFSVAPPIDSPEFKRWFGDSKVVDESGKPLVVYHQTTKSNEQSILENGGFSTDPVKARARLSDEQVPNGIFFKPDLTNIGVGSPNDSEISQMPVFLALRNPLVVRDRAALSWEVRQALPEYAAMERELKALDSRYGKEFDEVWKSPETPKDNTDPRYVRRSQEKSERLDDISERWTASIKEQALKMRKLVDEFLASAGYDGVIIENDVGSFNRKTKTLIALDSRQVKSATLNTGTYDPNNPDIRYSVAGPLWHSRLQKAIASAKQEKLTLDQLAALTKQNVDPEEIKWVGFDDWVAEKRAAGVKSVTKSEVLDFLTANAVNVEEVVKGPTKIIFEKDDILRDDTWVSDGPGAWTKNLSAPWVDPVEYRITLNDKTGEFDAEINSQGMGQYETLEEAQETLDDQINRDYQGLVDEVEADIRRLEEKGAAKFGAYQEPGGKNYRELLITLPVKRNIPTEDEIRKASREYKVAQEDATNVFGIEKDKWPQEVKDYVDDKLTEYERLSRALSDSRTLPSDKTFHSQHWDEPNVLAHIRFNERTDADGKKVLFLEEVQSDWHQEGRKKGYVGSFAMPSGWRIEKLKDANGQDYFAPFGPDGKERAGGPTEQYAIDEIAAELGNSESGQVPDAPFKKTWPLLAVKRAIRWAAENGFDRVAWANGEQNAAKYRLSKQVSRVEYASGDGDSPRALIAYDLDGREVVKKMAKPSELESYIGKDAAQKLMATTPESIGGKALYHKLSGLDLDVGGEGMKAFYDKILPAEVQKFIKKFGGRVMPAMGKNQGFDITPAMKASALSDGMPLFSVAESPNLNAEGLNDLPVAQVRDDPTFFERTWETLKDAPAKLVDALVGQLASERSAEENARLGLGESVRNLAEIIQRKEISNDILEARRQNEVLATYINEETSRIIRAVMRWTSKDSEFQKWLLPKVRRALAPVFMFAPIQRHMFHIAERMYWDDARGEMTVSPGFRTEQLEEDPRTGKMKKTGRYEYVQDVPEDMVREAYKALPNWAKEAITARAKKNEEFRQDWLTKVKPAQLEDINTEIEQLDAARKANAAEIKNLQGRVAAEPKLQGRIDKLLGQEFGIAEKLNKLTWRKTHLESNEGHFGYVHHYDFENTPAEKSEAPILRPGTSEWYESVAPSRKYRQEGKGYKDLSLLEADLTQVKGEARSAAENQMLAEIEETFGLTPQQFEELDKDTRRRMFESDFLGNAKPAVRVRALFRTDGMGRKPELYLPQAAYARYNNILHPELANEQSVPAKMALDFVDKITSPVNEAMLYHPTKFARDLLAAPVHVAEFLRDYAIRNLNNPAEIAATGADLLTSLKEIVDPAIWNRISKESRGEYSESLAYQKNKRPHWTTQLVDALGGKLGITGVGSTIGQVLREINLSGAGDLPVKRLFALVGEKIAARKGLSGIHRERFIDGIVNQYAFDTKDLSPVLSYLRGHGGDSLSQGFGVISRATVPFMGYAFRLFKQLMVDPIWKGVPALATEGKRLEGLAEFTRPLMWMAVVAALHGGGDDDETVAGNLQTKNNLSPDVRTAGRIRVGADDETEYWASLKGYGQLSLADALLAFVKDKTGDASVSDVMTEIVSLSPHLRLLLKSLNISGPYDRNVPFKNVFGQYLAQVLVPQLVRLGPDAVKGIKSFFGDQTIPDPKKLSFLEALMNQAGIPVGDPKMDAESNPIKTKGWVEALKLAGINIRPISYQQSTAELLEALRALDRKEEKSQKAHDYLAGKTMKGVPERQAAEKIGLSTSLDFKRALEMLDGDIDREKGDLPQAVENLPAKYREKLPSLKNVKKTAAKQMLEELRRLK